MKRTQKLAEIIREQRLEKGWSQLTFAKKIGYENSQFISNIERGVSMLPHYVLPKIAMVFNLALSDLEKQWMREFSSRTLHRTTMKSQRVRWHGKQIRAAL